MRLAVESEIYVRHCSTISTQVRLISTWCPVLSNHIMTLQGSASIARTVFPALFISSNKSLSFGVRTKSTAERSFSDSDLTLQREFH